MGHGQGDKSHRQEPDLVLGEEDRRAKGKPAQTEGQNYQRGISGQTGEGRRHQGQDFRYLPHYFTAPPKEISQYMVEYPIRQTLQPPLYRPKEENSVGLPTTDEAIEKQQNSSY